jgi:hypothetical protein
VKQEPTRKLESLLNSIKENDQFNKLVRIDNNTTWEDIGIIKELED